MLNENNNYVYFIGRTNILLQFHPKARTNDKRSRTGYPDLVVDIYSL